MRLPKPSSWVLPIVLTVAAVLPTAGWAAERCVLGEYFTATWCSGCAHAGPVLGGLMDANPTTFAAYQIHHLDDYATAWGDDRWTFYAVGYMPWLDLDGVIASLEDSDYAPDLASRQAVPTDVTVELFGTETAVQTYDVTARVCVEPGGVGKTMRVYMVHALDHWPPDQSYYRNTLRSGAATEDVALTADSCTTVTRSFTFDSISWAQQSDIKIIAWAQTPATLWPAEVHQAKVMHWPFTPFTDIFADDFETGTTDAWSAVLP